MDLGAIINAASTQEDSNFFTHANRRNEDGFRVNRFCPIFVVFQGLCLCLVGESGHGEAVIEFGQIARQVGLPELVLTGGRVDQAKPDRMQGLSIRVDAVPRGAAG